MTSRKFDSSLSPPSHFIIPNLVFYLQPYSFYVKSGYCLGATLPFPSHTHLYTDEHERQLNLPTYNVCSRVYLFINLSNDSSKNANVILT